VKFGLGKPKQYKGNIAANKAKKQTILAIRLREKWMLGEENKAILNELVVNSFTVNIFLFLIFTTIHAIFELPLFQIFGSL
jgi:hypothetical protein